MWAYNYNYDKGMYNGREDTYVLSHSRHLDKKI
jgi:hypothetical protein